MEVAIENKLNLNNYMRLLNSYVVYKDCSEESDSHPIVNKTSRIARKRRKHCGHSSRIHSVGRQEAKSKERQDLRNLKHAKTETKRNKIKKGKASTNHMNMSGRNTRFSEPDMKKPGKEKPKNAREQKNCSPKYMGMAELSANNLSDPLSHPDSQFKQTRLTNHSSWLLPSRDEIDSSLHIWTKAMEFGLRRSGDINYHQHLDI